MKLLFPEDIKKYKLLQNRSSYGCNEIDTKFCLKLYDFIFCEYKKQSGYPSVHENQIYEEFNIDTHNYDLDENGEYYPHWTEYAIKNEEEKKNIWKYLHFLCDNDFMDDILGIFDDDDGYVITSKTRRDLKKLLRKMKNDK